MKIKRIILLLLVLLLPLSLLTLVSCGAGDDEGKDDSTGASLTLNVYNWGEYISDGSLGSLDTNAEFEKYYYEKTGQKVKVNYTTYATNEDMYAKITSGAGRYDILIPSDYMIEKLIGEGFLEPFNPKETVENYGYINEDFRGENVFYDPTEMYSVPYTYGMIGVIYNTTLVDPEDAEKASWSLLWDEKYAGKILQFNNPRDAFGAAMYYKNLDINTTDESVWREALSLLLRQKPLVQGYVSDEIYNKMISGSAAIAPYYAGDFITMADAENGNPYLDFFYPTEGTNYFVDAMVIPKNAPQKEIAIEYINFMLSEEIAIANAEYIGYASPNDVVRNSAQYAEDMGEDAMRILYGVSASEANQNYSFDPCYHSFTPEMHSFVNGLWEELKTESSIEVWLHITSGILLVSVITLGVYTFYMRKKRSRHYRYRDRGIPYEPKAHTKNADQAQNS